MTVSKPNFYKQFDSRWASKSWRGCTVAAYGCGESAVANIVSATVNPKVTPYTAWKWATAHGYMCPGAGTYWSGIGAMLTHYGIKDWYTATDFSAVKAALKKNAWVIGIMTKGRWTSGGHFIVAYYVDSKDRVYVSDSASYAESRHIAPWSDFKSQCNNVWMVIPAGQAPKQEKKTETVTLYANNSLANVRKKPDADSAKLGRIEKNKKLTLKYTGNDWYKIMKGAYMGGYIHASNLSKYKNVSVSYKVAASGGMKIREGYSTKTASIGVVPKGTILRSDKQRGLWAHVKKQKGYPAGWIKIKTSAGVRYLTKVK